MVSCRLCGTPLQAPISVARGYGPVCWKKLQKDSSRQERLYGETVTITNQAEASESIRKVIELMTAAREHYYEDEPLRCSCGEKFEPGNLEYFDHEGGISLKGFGVPQWLYHHCPKCNYDYALWKKRIPGLNDLGPCTPAKSPEVATA